MVTLNTPATTPVEPANNTAEWSCRSRSERLYPDGEWNPSAIFGKYNSNDHPFLQKLITIGAHVTIMQGEWTVLAYSSVLLLHIHKDFINIECIATPEEFRNQGSGSKTMKALVTVSDETQIPLRLRACNVTGHGWNMLPQHIAVAKGMAKKGKIPVNKLHTWYEKFGFKCVARVFRKGKFNGWNMEYTPKPKQ